MGAGCFMFLYSNGCQDIATMRKKSSRKWTNERASEPTFYQHYRNYLSLLWTSPACTCPRVSIHYIWPIYQRKYFDKILLIGPATVQRRSAAAAAAVVTIPILRSKAATVTTLGEPCSVCVCVCVCVWSRGSDSSPNPLGCNRPEWVTGYQSVHCNTWLVQVLWLLKTLLPLQPNSKFSV